jgi:hypothetical protein
MPNNFLNLTKKTYCILLKVLPDFQLNEERYHNNLIYYPVNRITGKDSKEV